MLRFLLAVPAVLFAFVWSLFVPPRYRTPLPPLPDPDAPSAESRADGHEVSDASAKDRRTFRVGLFAVIFTAMAALGVMYKRMYADTDAIPVRPVQESFKYAPQDKTSIAKDWDTIDRLAHERLDGYGWTDKATASRACPSPAPWISSPARACPPAPRKPRTSHRPNRRNFP